MKLPRWLLVILLVASAVALVAVPAWLWVEMPRRTATRFMSAIEAGDAERMNELLAGSVCMIDRNVPVYRGRTLNVANLQIELEPTGSADVLRGRRVMIARTRDGLDAGVRFYATWRQVTMDTSVMEAAISAQKAFESQLRQQAQSRMQQPSAALSRRACRDSRMDVVRNAPMDGSNADQHTAPLEVPTTELSPREYNEWEDRMRKLGDRCVLISLK
jgi:hypothetical protein